MVLTYEIGISSATVWNILDHFLIDLANLGDDICKSPVLTKPLYMDLVKLVCEGKKDALKLIAQGKPYYPFILILYYMLFHNHNLAIAEAIYNELTTMYNNYPYSFDGDEECALEMLGKILEDFKSLSMQPMENYKGRLNARIKEIAFKIEKTKCSEEGWSKLFKKVLLSNLIPEESIKYLGSILEEMSSFEKFIIEEEIAEKYNLIGSGGTTAIHIFLEKVSNNIKKKIMANLSELNRLSKIEEELKSKMEKIKKFEKIVENPFLKFFTTLPPIGAGVLSIYLLQGINWGILPLCFGIFFSIVSLYHCYYNKKLSKIRGEINDFVEKHMLKDLYDTIWSSAKHNLT